jgi:hypothetical protein
MVRVRDVNLSEKGSVQKLLTAKIVENSQSSQRKLTLSACFGRPPRTPRLEALAGGINRQCGSSSHSGRPSLCRLVLRLPGFQSDQPVEIIAVRTIGAERLLIEKALDAATQAYLVRVLLKAHRPAHFPVPAASKYQDRCASYSSCHQTERNLPTRLLFFSHQNPTTNRPHQLD